MAAAIPQNSPANSFASSIKRVVAEVDSCEAPAASSAAAKQHKVVYTLKTSYRDGTTQVAFEPVDFVARLAVLVPKPRVLPT
jgi:hypothetical protein